MKSYLITFALVIFSSCDNNSFLANEVSPVTKAYIGYTNNCQPIGAEMLTKNSALLYTGRYVLFCEDDFKKISYIELEGTSTCGDRLLYNDGYTVWLLDQNSNFIYKRNPKLNSISFISPGYFSLSYPKITPVLKASYFLDSVNLLFPAIDFSKQSIEIYRGDITKKTALLISTIKSKGISFLPEGLLLTEKTMVVLAKDDNSSYYSFTSLDGVNWTEPNLISKSGRIEYFEGNSNTLVSSFVTYDNGNISNRIIFISSDAGSTWKQVNNQNQKFIYVQSLPDGNLVGVIEQRKGDIGTISKLAKSTDMGLSWQIIGNEFYGDYVCFFDQQNGVAISLGTLQATRDGGKTWKLIFASI
jgi:hypothetical protein